MLLRQHPLVTVQRQFVTRETLKVVGVFLPLFFFILFSKVVFLPFIFLGAVVSYSRFLPSSTSSFSFSSSSSSSFSSSLPPPLHLLILSETFFPGLSSRDRFRRALPSLPTSPVRYSAIHYFHASYSFRIGISRSHLSSFANRTRQHNSNREKRNRNVANFIRTSRRENRRDYSRMIFFSFPLLLILINFFLLLLFCIGVFFSPQKSTHSSITNAASILAQIMNKQ